MGRDNSPYKRLANALCEDAFLRKLGISRREMRRVFGAADWKSLLEPLFPIRERLSCAQALEVLLPFLVDMSYTTDELLFRCAYYVVVTILVPIA